MRTPRCGPVVLYAVERGVRRVVACSRQAARLGVRLGMPLAEATALLGPPGGSTKAPHEALAVRPWDPEADREQLVKLAIFCGQFSPTVGIEDSPAPECLLLEIGRVAGLFGGEESLVRRVAGWLAAQGLEARLCVADTIGAAWAGARWLTGALPERAKDELPAQGRVEKIRRSEIRMIVLPPGKSGCVLRRLPVEALRLTAETVELLHRLGLCRIGQLEDLPRNELGARFGPELLRRLDQAFGRWPEPIVAAGAVECYRAEWSGEAPLVSLEQITEVVDGLLQRIVEKLRADGRGAVELVCRLDCLGSERVPIHLCLFRPSASAIHLAGLFQLRFESLRLPEAVVAVQLEATHTAPL